MATFLTYNFAKPSSLQAIAVLRQAYRCGRPSRVWDINQARYASFQCGQHANQQYLPYCGPFQLDALPNRMVASPRRSYSTQNSPVDQSQAKSEQNKPEEPKKKGFFATAKSTVKDVLIPGCKELWYDFKSSRANKKKLKANNNDYTTLTRAEYYKIIQVTNAIAFTGTPKNIHSTILIQIQTIVNDILHVHAWLYSYHKLQSNMICRPTLFPLPLY